MNESVPAGRKTDSPRERNKQTGDLVTAAFASGAIVTADVTGGVAVFAGADTAHGHEAGVQQCADAHGADAAHSSIPGVNGMSSSAASTVKHLVTIRIAPSA